MSFYSKKEATSGIELVSKALSSENDTISILKGVQTTEKVLLEHLSIQSKKWQSLELALKNE